MKKNKAYKLPFIGLDDDKLPLIYHENGHYSTFFKIQNPIERFNGDTNKYYEFHSIMSNIIKTLGSGYHLQKLDVFSKEVLSYDLDQYDDYLTKSYFDHFNGRDYKNIHTYLVITKISEKTLFKTYDEKIFLAFLKKIDKIKDVLSVNDFRPVHLNNKEQDLLIKRFVGFNFKDKSFSLNSTIKVEDDHINIGNRMFKSSPIIDINEVQLPVQVEPTTSIDIGYAFPTDMFSFFYDLDIDLMIYNQVFYTKDQGREKKAIQSKRDRHKSMPDPANKIAMEDIDGVLNEMAKSNQILINCHFSCNFIDTQERVNQAYNTFETKLSMNSIHPSNRAFNQFELFSSIIPGNSSALKEYDFFKTTIDPALCFVYKENISISDQTDFQIHFTDRNGIPVVVDPSDLPMIDGRITARNKFILGPSGSGKSFFMNSMLRQYGTYDTDIVLVDTGHSYSGLCEYYGGTYLTYSEEKPITMNPFFLHGDDEVNIEKKESLKSLVGLLWKGVDGKLSKIEDTVLGQVIDNYIDVYYFGKDTEGNDLKYKMNFNSFYEFSLKEIEKIIQEENIEFAISKYKFILKAFYKGGQFDTLLNAGTDNSLFEKKLIVFEIDSIKDHKILFPIVTIIIMDVFIQKMRFKDNRKCLIIEEAWKAIASPMMAGYILYLYKTVRKFNGEAMLVTQELNDIIGSEVLKDSVLANSDTIILLDQTKFKDNYDQVKTLLSLNEVELNKIFTVNNLDNKSNRPRFKEAYIKIGSEGRVVGVEVSTKEYLTFTTELKEKLALKYYQVQHEDITEALEHFVNDLKESGNPLNVFVKSVNQKNQTFKKALNIAKKSNNISQEEFINEFRSSGEDFHTYCQNYINHQKQVS